MSEVEVDARAPSKKAAPKLSRAADRRGNVEVDPQEGQKSCRPIWEFSQKFFRNLDAFMPNHKAFIVIAAGAALFSGINSIFSLPSAMAQGAPWTMSENKTELIFRLEHYIGISGETPSLKEWRLNIPTSFVESQIGINGDSHKKTGFVAQLQMDVNSESWETRVTAGQGPTSEPWSFLAIFVSNRETRRATKSSGDVCLDRQDLREQGGMDMRQNYNPAPLMVRDCQTPFCGISMSHRGWSINVMVRQDLYLKKDAVCMLTHKILSGWTQSIDDLRR